MKNDWFTTDMIESFRKALSLYDQQTGVMDDICSDDASDEVILVEKH